MNKLMGLRKKYERHFMCYEFILSIVIIFAIYLTWNRYSSPEKIHNWICVNKDALYPLIATISGTLLGFVITGVSVIIAFSESDKVELLKKSKHYGTIFDVYFSAIRYLALSTILAIIGILINDGCENLAFFVIAWSVLISTFRLGRCLWILERVVELIKK